MLDATDRICYNVTDPRTHSIISCHNLAGHLSHMTQACRLDVRHKYTLNPASYWSIQYSTSTTDGFGAHAFAFLHGPNPKFNREGCSSDRWKQWHWFRDSSSTGSPRCPGMARVRITSVFSFSLAFSLTRRLHRCRTESGGLGAVRTLMEAHPEISLDLNVIQIALDDLQSVAKCAKTFLSKVSRLDILICKFPSGPRVVG